MKRITIVAMIVFIAAAIVSCASPAIQAQETQTEQEQAAVASESPLPSGGESGPAEDTGEVTASIFFSGSGAEVTGDGAEVSGAGVTITGGGTYEITGQTTDGNITANAPGEDVILILNGVDITNPDGPAILIHDAANATVTIAEGTENTLADGGDGDYDGVLYGIVSYTINGGGVLNINGNVEEGIAGEMNITIDGGAINISAPDDGINANNDGVSELTINGGELRINAGGDGIDSNGSLTINGGAALSYGSVDDMNGGLDADGDIIINGGTVFASGASNSPVTGGDLKYIIYGFDSIQSGGGTVSVKQDGNELFSTVVENAYQSILFGDPSIEDDIDYDIYVDGFLVSSTNTKSGAASGMTGKRPSSPPDNVGGNMPPAASPQNDA